MLVNIFFINAPFFLIIYRRDNLITKLYNYIKENIKFFLIILFVFLICTIKLPYYIDAPGGLLDVSSRVYISGATFSSGSFNLAYVSEIDATIPTLLISLFNDDWDVYKKEEKIISSLTVEEMEYRNNILLEESKGNAILVGFNLAGESVNIKNTKLYITHVANDAFTDLKIGDEIIKINNIEVNSKKEVQEMVSLYDKFNIEVINDGVTYIREAHKKDGLIGISINEVKEFETSRDVLFKFKNSESGPSGGFMMALSIYDYLIDEDLTKGLKIVGTGTIDEDGNVGVIGGVSYKLKAAVKEDASIFFVPDGNYEEALKVKNEENLNIELVSVSNINDAINYLRNL